MKLKADFLSLAEEVDPVVARLRLTVGERVIVTCDYSVAKTTHVGLVAGVGSDPSCNTCTTRVVQLYMIELRKP